MDCASCVSPAPSLRRPILPWFADRQEQRSSSGQVTLGARQISAAPQQFTEGEGGGSVKRRQTLSLFERGTGVIGFSETFISKAQVIGDLRVGGISLMNRLEQFFCLGVTK